MSKMPDELYESFKANLEKVDGKCFRASKDTLAETLTGLFKELDIKDTCIAETPLLKEAGVAEALKNAGAVSSSPKPVLSTTFQLRRPVRVPLSPGLTYPKLYISATLAL